MISRRSNISSYKSQQFNNCSPTLIQQGSLNYHYILWKQIQFLNRGSSYISPGQIHILTQFTSLNTNDMLQKQEAPLQRQLTRLFSKYPVDLSR